MNVVVSGIIQKLDMKTKSSVNLLELQLPTGVKLQVSIQESDLAAVLEAVYGEEDPEPLAQYDRMQGPPPSDLDTYIFGGSSPVEPSFERPVIRPSEAPHPPEDVRPVEVPGTGVRMYVGRSGNGKDTVATPLRTVMRTDEAGNPLLPGVAVADVSSYAEEEDFVPSA